MHSVVVEKSDREQFNELQKLWLETNSKLSHSRCPAAICGTLDSREIFIFKIYDSEKNLVAFMPFEKKRICGVTIIRPAFYELTLDFIDMTVEPSWEQIAANIFLDWVKAQPNSVLDFFMSSEASLLAQSAIEDGTFLVEARGKYFYLDLPEDFESFINGLSKSVRQDARKVLRSYENEFKFEVVEKGILGDQLSQAIDDLMYLHAQVFPKDSAMLPHKENLTKYLEKAFSDSAIFFTRAREISTGKIVATDLFAKSDATVGLIQNGRIVDPKYSKIGTWILLKTIEWSIEEKMQRLEFLFGDQEYKRRLGSGVKDAVSITYFSSQRSRYTFRIMQRLGRYIKTLR